MFAMPSKRSESVPLETDSFYLLRFSGSNGLSSISLDRPLYHNTVRPIRERRLPSGAEKADRLRLQHQTGEVSAVEGAGVDADPVRLHLRAPDYRVAMHHPLAEIFLRAKKWRADPQQVARQLHVEG